MRVCVCICVLCFGLCMKFLAPCFPVPLHKINQSGVPQGHLRVRSARRVLRHRRPRQAREPLPQRGAEVDRGGGAAGRPAALLLHDALRGCLQERNPGMCMRVCVILVCRLPVIVWHSYRCGPYLSNSCSARGSILILSPQPQQAQTAVYLGFISARAVEHPFLRPISYFSTTLSLDFSTAIVSSAGRICMILCAFLPACLR